MLKLKSLLPDFSVITNALSILIAKPALLYLALLSFSISLCSSLQLSNLSNIFKFLGASSSQLPLLWLVPPITGLFVQPIVGQLSDDTATRWGKRQPYILGYGLLAVISFCCLPWAASIWTALFGVWIIDCCLNGSTEALRALTGDIIKSDNASYAFALQAIFAGVGGALGASLPYLAYSLMGVQSKVTFGHIPRNLQMSMLAAAGILFVALVFGFRGLKEKAYKSILLFKKQKPMNFGPRLMKTGKDLVSSFKKIKPEFMQICWCHAISWIGIFIFWLYFSTVLAQNVYGLPTHHIKETAATALLWQKASLDSSYYFSMYQYVSIVYALFLYFTSHKMNQRILHGVSIAFGGVGIAMLGFAHTQTMVFWASIGAGIMWGSMIVLPYSIALRLLPRGKLGIYFGIFNICITLPQIMCSLLLSPVYLYVFQRHASYLMILAGSLILVSSYMWMRKEKPVGYFNGFLNKVGFNLPVS